MKKTLFTLFCVLFLVTPAIAGPGDGIAGSKHDFTSSGWQTRPDGDGSLGLCEVCHTPHSDSSKPILWNKDLTSGGSYDNTLQTAFLTSWGTPDGATLLCLSCHDGTIALDNYGGLTGGTNFIAGESQIGNGSTLAGNHPVSIPYTSALIGTELKTVASVEAIKVVIYLDTLLDLVKKSQDTKLLDYHRAPDEDKQMLYDMNGLRLAIKRVEKHFEK